MNDELRIVDHTPQPLKNEVTGPEWFEKLTPEIQKRIARLVFIGGPILLLTGVGILQLSRPTDASRRRDAQEKRVQQLSESEWLLLLPELDMSLDELREAFHIKNDMDIGEALMRERIYTFEQLKQSFQVRFFIHSRTPSAVLIMTVRDAEGREYMAIKRIHENGEVVFLDYETRQPIT